MFEALFAFSLARARKFELILNYDLKFGNDVLYNACRFLFVGFI